MKATLPFRYITTTKRGKIYICFDFRDKDNTRLRKWVSTGLDENCSKKELKEKTDTVVSEFYRSYLDGSVFENRKKKGASDSNGASTGYEFTEFLLFWLETNKHTIAETTFESYNRCINKTVDYFQKNYPGLKLENLKAVHLQQFYNDMYNSNLSANTVKHYHANIHKALNYAVKIDLLPQNVSEKTDRPKISKYQATFYNSEELLELFKIFEGDKIELVVFIAAYYGLRRSEIIGLRWSAIDFDENTITIQEKAYTVYENGKIVTKFHTDLKTKSSYRTLPLIPVVKDKLIAKQKLNKYFSEIAGRDYNHDYDEYVCTDKLGCILCPDFVSDHFRHIVNKSGIKKIRLHDLRHSCASLLLANGVPMKAIQEWLGHSTFHVTADYYSHLEYNSKISSAETIANALNSISSETEDKTDEE